MAATAVLQFAMHDKTVMIRADKIVAIRAGVTGITIIVTDSA
jgi:hypothetical protein